jgi:hypothetical protein
MFDTITPMNIESSRGFPLGFIMEEKARKIKKKLVRTIMSPIMPTEIEGEENIAHIENLFNEGYKIFFAYNHFSFPDTFHVIKDFIFKNKLMQDKKCVLPISLGVHNIFKPLIEPIAHTQNIKLCPVVTPASLEELNSKHQKQIDNAKISHFTTRTSFRKLLRKQIMQEID